MQFLTGLLGEQGGSIATAFFALVFVLALIVFGMWALKVAFGTGSRLTRAKPRRLNIVERLPVDGRRQLLIVRRDEVEHLVMTGGGQDLVIESGIPRPGHAATAADGSAPARQGHEASLQPAAAPDRPAPLAVPVATEAAARKPQLPGHAEPVREALAERIRRGGPSLRHTALLRPVSAMDPPVTPMPALPGDKSGRPPSDSDRTPQGIDGDGGRDDLGAAAYFGDKGGANRS